MRIIKHFFEWLGTGLHGADYLILAFLVLVMVTVILFNMNGRKKTKFRRAEFTAKLLEKMHADPEIQSFIQKIESGEEWYQDEFLQDKKSQSEVFHVLSFFNYICYLEENHVISMDEYMLFEFSIQSLAMNSSFRNYMFELFHKTEEENKMFPFYYLLDSCAEKMPGGFLDEKSDNYKKVKFSKRKK